ncbi:MAG: histidinol-phosphate transaminase [Clostridiales bacterium]|nr:histidinol-phosphate transaminase [Clostridiales bacterium]
MEKLWREKLRKIVPYIPGEQPDMKDVIKLNANENPYPPSPMVTKVIQNFDASTLRLYPDANATEFRSALASYYGVEKNQIFVGNGSDDVLALAFQSFFHSEQPVLFPDITYSFYHVWCSLFDIAYELVPLTEDFRINAKDYYRKNGGVIFPNPNAPTGFGEGRDFIEDILTHNQDCIVILDETYVDFGGYTALELLKKYENLLITRTFSKARSLAGMRIGVAIGNPCLIETLEAVKNSYNSYTMDRLALSIGTASVKDMAYFQETIEKIKTTRKWTANELQKLGFEVFPSQSNFLFVKPSGISAKDLFEKLREDHIFIRYFNQPRIDAYLRITIGTDNDMKAMVSAIKRYLSSSQN